MCYSLERIGAARSTWYWLRVTWCWSSPRVLLPSSLQTFPSHSIAPLPRSLVSTGSHQGYLPAKAPLPFGSVGWNSKFASCGLSSELIHFLKRCGCSQRFRMFLQNLACCLYLSFDKASCCRKENWISFRIGLHFCSRLLIQTYGFFSWGCLRWPNSIWFEQFLA